MMSKRLCLAALLLLLAAHVAAAQGRECPYGQTPCEAYAGADAVFIGRVTRIVPETFRRGQTEDDYDQTAYVAVEKVFKGYRGRRIVLRQLGSRHAQKFIGGSRYLFYANYDRAARLWEVKPCGRTRMAEYPHDDLRYLHALPANAGRARLAGELTRFDPDPDTAGTTERLAGVRLRIVGDEKEYEVTSDADGAYEIYDLPPGRYVVRPRTPPGLAFLLALHSGPSPRERVKSLEVEVKPGACAGLDIIFTTEKNLKPETGEGVGRAARR